MSTSDTALLIMDVQNGIARNYPDPDFAPRLNIAATAARTAGLPVIFVGVEFREGHPEISSRNKVWSGVAAGNALITGSEAVAFVDDIPREAGDVEVRKRRIGAFSGSDLDVILRSKGITHLVLAGISTSGVVLSTVRLAGDLDYQLTVLSDGVLDNDPEVHRVLVEKLFPRQANVVTTAEWTASLDAS